MTTTWWWPIKEKPTLWGGPNFLLYYPSHRNGETLIQDEPLAMTMHQPEEEKVAHMQRTKKGSLSERGQQGGPPQQTLCIFFGQKAYFWGEEKN